MTRRQKTLGFLIVLIAALLRFDRIWHWSLDGDEFYAWRDVSWLLDEGFVNDSLKSHPIGYLGIAAIAKVAGLNEWTARLFSTALGTAAVAVLTWMRRDAVPARVGLLVGGWVAVSPWLIYHAQTARVYGPLIFFASLAVMWWLPGEKRRPWAGTAAFVLAMLSHPSALALLPGVLIAGLLSRRTRRASLVVAGGGIAAGAVALFATDSTMVRLVREALELRDFASYDAMHYVLGLGYNSHGLLLPAAVALVFFAASRRDSIGWLAAVGFAGPALLGLAALLGVSVHQRYAMSAIPAVFLVGGWGAHLLLERRRALGIVLALVPFIVPLPALVAHLRDGNRHDWRGMAQILAERADPEDIIAADEHALLEVYLGRHEGFDDEDLHFEVPLDKPQRYDSFLGNSRDCWVVVKASRVEGGYGEAFTVWLDTYFEEVARWGSPPVPLTRHDNTLLLYKRTARVIRRDGDR